MRRTLDELSFNNAGGWDAIPDSTFKLCYKCRKLDAEFCKTCSNVALCTRQIFTKKFWQDPSSRVHLNARLVALDKSKNGKPDPTEFRPIVLCSVVSKILEAYFMHQLRDYCSNKLHINQVGGVKNRSILDNVLRLHLEKVKFGKDAHAMFIDFRGAFSNLPREWALNEIINRRALDKNGLMLLRFLYQETTIKMGSKEVKLTKGVPMGFLSSPSVFAIGLEKLLEMLDEKGLISLLYCDDLAIIGSKNDLLKAKKIIEDFCSLTKFEISHKKSAVVKLSRKNKKLDNKKFWEPLPY